MKKNILIFILILIFINTAPVKAKPKVLVIHSYRQGVEWTDKISQGIQSVFIPKGEVDVYYDYLNAKINYSAEYYEQLIELYKKKSERLNFKAIIACDNVAFDFLLKHRKELYPKTPIVFCGINNYNSQMIKGRRDITGIIEKPSHKENIDLILKLHPKINKLVIVTDQTRTGKNITAELREKLIPYHQRLNIELINDFNFDDSSEKINEFDKQVAIYLLVVNRDSTGRFISYSEGMEKIKHNYENPIYGAWDIYLDKGIVGGKLISGYEQGKEAAQLVERILKGEEVAQIPVKASKNRYLFDYKQLNKFNISLDKLPTRNKIINYSQPFYIEYKDLFWKIVSGTLILVIIIFILVINILKRKKVEKELYLTNKKLVRKTSQLKEETDKLLNIAEVYIVFLNKNGEVERANKQGYQFLGLTKEEVIGKNLFDNYVKEEERERLKDIFARQMNREKINCVETTLITKSGEERQVISQNALLEDKNGNIKGLLVSALDITEQKTLKEELRYNQFKIEFFANLSHELKTPLNLLFSALQMLNQYRKNNLSVEVNHDLDRYTDVIKRNNYRLLRLVNNLVDITKIDSNSFELELQNCDIVKLVRKATSSVSDYVVNKERNLKFNAEIDSKVIACDPLNIERITLNLLSNAIKFTEKGDEIYVNLKEKGKWVIITVKDTGIGITKEKEEMIFKMFRQVNKSFTRQNEGSGIGLTLVKLLVELHNGEIIINSQPGEFSEFIVKLPAIKLTKESSNNTIQVKSLVDRIKIEFSDVYGL